MYNVGIFCLVLYVWFIRVGLFVLRFVWGGGGGGTKRPFFYNGGLFLEDILQRDFS